MDYGHDVSYAHHKDFERPAPEAKIWRYVDFAKLVDLVDRQALFFARADSMMDPWEGVLSNLRDDGTDFLSKLVAAAHAGLLEERSDIRARMFLSCWHLADVESAAMWDLYGGRDGRGIAIQSTFERLEAALPSTGGHSVYAGKVKYIDYQRDVFGFGNPFTWFLHKRRSFAHEQELRAIFYAYDAVEPLPLGFNVPVDVRVLIEHIYVAPTTPVWFQALVERTVGRYEIAARVIRSDLLTGPLE